MPKAVTGDQSLAVSQNGRLANTLEREGRRLRSFIRRRVRAIDDVEDILQDVFYELVRAERLMEPIEQVGGWLVRVARNRIIDRFRKQRPGTFTIRSKATR